MKISEITAYFEKIYGILNTTLFNGELSPICIVIGNSNKSSYERCDVWKSKGQGYRQITLSSDVLNVSIYDAITSLLHEMIHHYCNNRGIKETSRNDVYHNKLFKKEAELRGLIVEYEPRNGHSILSPSNELKAFIDSKGWHVLWGQTNVKPIHIDGAKQSSTRKYICPSCGNSVRATKIVNICCLDCNIRMQEVLKR